MDEFVATTREWNSSELLAHVKVMESLGSDFAKPDLPSKPGIFRTAVCCELLDRMVPDDSNSMVGALKREVFKAIYPNFQHDAPLESRFVGLPWFAAAQELKTKITSVTHQLETLMSNSSSTVSERSRRQEGVMQRTLARMFSRSIGNSFMGWRSVAVAAKRKRLLLADVERRWRSRELPKVFEHWVCLIDQAKLARASAEAQALREDLRWDRLQVAELEEQLEGTVQKLQAAKQELERLKLHNDQLQGLAEQEESAEAVFTQDALMIKALQSLTSVLSTEMIHLYKERLHGSAYCGTPWQDVFLLYDGDVIAVPSNPALSYTGPGAKWKNLQQFMLQVPVEHILLRWVNFHLARAHDLWQPEPPPGLRHKVGNLTSEMSDCTAYVQLCLSALDKIDTNVASTVLTVKPETRPGKFLAALSEASPAGDVIGPQDIAKGNNINVVLVASLFCAHPALNPDNVPERVAALEALESLEASYLYVASTDLTGESGLLGEIKDITKKVSANIQTIQSYLLRARIAQQCYQLLRTDVHQYACAILYARSIGVKTNDAFEEFKTKVGYRRASMTQVFRVHRARISDLFSPVQTPAAVTTEVEDVNRLIGKHQTLFTRLFTQLGGSVGGRRGVTLSPFQHFCQQNAIIKGDLTPAEIEKIYKLVIGPQTLKAVKGVFYKSPPPFMSAAESMDETRFTEAIYRVACLKYAEQDDGPSKLRCLLHYDLHIKDP